MTQTLEAVPTSWEWEEHEPAPNGPTWLAVLPTEHEDESVGCYGEPCEDGCVTMHMIAPANDEPDGIYGWYTDDVNPGYCFPREFLPELLAMGLDEMRAWLSARVSPSAKTYGMPWYVWDRTVKDGPC